MRSLINKFNPAAVLVAAACGALALSAAPAGAQQSALAAHPAQPDTAAAKEYDSAKRHTMTGYKKYCLDRDDVKGCVMPYGDILWLDDQEADGYGVKLIWWDTDGPRHGECANNTGSGGFGADWARCNKNLPENHEIKWVVSWYESGQWHNSRAGYTKV